jgi:hypothetical protein
MNDDSDKDPHAHDDKQNKHEDEGWDQLHKDYNESHDNKDNDEFDTPGLSSDEDDLATILDLPPAKPKRRDIMDDTNEAASTMTNVNMTGDLIVMHENAITVNVQELHTGEEDTFAKKKLLANDTNSYDEKHLNIKMARNDGMHRDVDNEHTATLKRPEAYGAARKVDMMNKTNPETNIETICMGPHTRETMEDPIVKVLTEYEEEPNVPMKKELPVDNKMVDKHEYEEESLTKYEHLRCENVMTSQTETVDATKMLAYMDENYNIPSQKGDEDEPFAALEREKPNVRVDL